jgi:hypothetical protein
MLWLALSIAIVAAIAALWAYAWLRRKRRPPGPTRPYREWKD